MRKRWENMDCISSYQRIIDSAGKNEIIMEYKEMSMRFCGQRQQSEEKSICGAHEKGDN